MDKDSYFCIFLFKTHIDTLTHNQACTYPHNYLNVRDITAEEQPRNTHTVFSNVSYNGVRANTYREANKNTLS